MKIGKHKIGLKFPPFIIAEMSGNHKKSLKRALKIVDAAADAGVSAIKLQTYKPETMTIKSKRAEFQITDKNNLWYGSELFDLFNLASTPYEWHKPIFEHAKKRGLAYFSSPFSEDAVDFLEKLNVQAYKIASFENNHYPLIEKVASTNKPIIVSTGMATLKEIQEVKKIISLNGKSEIAFLKCTSSYPADPSESNILSISKMRKTLKCEIGLSDHTCGVGAAIAAIANQATIIEKHITLKKNDGAIDGNFSLDKNDFSILTQEGKVAWKSLGKAYIGPTAKEKNSVKFKRSIYTIKDIKKGDKFSKENISVIRPSNGLHPKYYNKLIGETCKHDIKRGIPLTAKYISKKYLR